MKKNENGLYESTKFIRSTNQEVTGLGSTKDEARADMKKKLKEYRDKPVDVSGLFKSPGYELYQDGNKNRFWRKNPNRMAFMMARPELAVHLREARKVTVSEDGRVTMPLESPVDQNVSAKEVESVDHECPKCKSHWVLTPSEKQQLDTRGSCDNCPVEPQ